MTSTSPIPKPIQSNTGTGDDIPVAHPVAHPVARLVVEATPYNVIRYCRRCGDVFIPDVSLQYSAQSFRCPECTNTQGFAHMVVNSCVLM